MRPGSPVAGAPRGDAPSARSGRAIWRAAREPIRARSFCGTSRRTKIIDSLLPRQKRIKTQMMEELGLFVGFCFYYCYYYFSS